MCPGSAFFPLQGLRGSTLVVNICIWSGESPMLPDFAIFMLYGVQLQQHEGKAVDTYSGSTPAALPKP